MIWNELGHRILLPQQQFLLVGLHSKAIQATVPRSKTRLSSTKFHCTPRMFCSDLPLFCASPNEVLVYDYSSRTTNSNVALSPTNTSSRIQLSYISLPVDRMGLILRNLLSLSSICFLKSGEFVTNLLRWKPPSANLTLDLMFSS